MQFRDLLPIGITFVAVTILLSFGAKILADVGSTFAPGSTEDQIMNNGSASLLTLGSNLNTLALVMIAGIIIASVVAAFYFKSR